MRGICARYALVVLSSIAGLLGCSPPAPVEPPEPIDPKLTLAVDGVETDVAITELDIYLVEDSAYPEHFRFEGPGIELVGEFPLDIHVDYGEHWEVLLGRPIAIAHTTDYPRLNGPSRIRLPNLGSVEIVSGTFTVERIGASYDSDTQLFGTISLTYAGDSGDVTLSGRFAVNASTWG